MKDILNAIFLPVRLILSHETINKIGLRSMRDERYDIITKNIQGRLIDVGCGNNELVRKYGHDSVGVDVFDFNGGAMIVDDTSKLPFADESFDSASFVACLNHIVKREEVLLEVKRLLTPGGRVYMTMLTPFWGVLRHKLAWWDPDQNHRGMKQGETMGLSTKYIINLFKKCGYNFILKKGFVLGLNNMYIFEKE